MQPSDRNFQTFGNGQNFDLMTTSGNEVIFIKTEQIHWIESASNYVIIHNSAERHIIREIMATLKSDLRELETRLRFG